jgi:predicted anti-sigma-YlaC factor YlaD
MTMDCRLAQEQILECLDAAVWPVEVRAHVSQCEACAAFLRVQTSVDRRLTTALAAPRLSTAFRPALRRKMIAERPSWLRDTLPDILHFTGWSVATAAGAVLLTIDPAFVLVAGASAALSSYVLLTLIRSSLEEL